MTSNPEKDEVLYAKINLETAQIPWKELERFFVESYQWTIPSI